MWDRYLQGDCVVSASPASTSCPPSRKGDALPCAGASTGQDAGPIFLPGLTTVPVPSQYQPLGGMKVRDWCLLL